MSGADASDKETPAAFLKARSSLAARPALAEAAGRLFEYAQFLLDRDENLTKIGNLSGAARDRLRQRALELLGGADAGDTSDADADEGTAP
jgi:hypothetical protein